MFYMYIVDVEYYRIHLDSNNAYYYTRSPVR